MILNQIVKSKKGLSLYIRLAQEQDIPQLEQVINWAYRGKEGVNPWTCEDKLVSGKRINIDGLQREIAKDKQLTQVVVVELIIDNNNQDGADNSGASEADQQLEQTNSGKQRRIVGCIKLDRNDNTSNKVLIGMFGVDPSLQSNGIGQILFQTAEKIAMDEWGCIESELHVLSVRDELLAWYYSMKYKPTGEMTKFVNDHNHIDTPLIKDLAFSTLIKQLIK